LTRNQFMWNKVYTWICLFNCATHANNVGPNYVTADVIAYLLRRLFLVPDCFNLLNYPYA